MSRLYSNTMIRRTSQLLLALFVLGFLAACRDNRGMVVGKVKKASKLATVEFTIDKLVYGVKSKRLLWVVKLNEANFLAHSQAFVKAGIDLEQLKEEDIKIEGKKISLLLPHVQVINFSYPAEKFVMDTIISGDAFLNNIRLEDQEEFFQEAEIDIRNSLKHMGIVEETQKKTRVMLEGMLRNLGYTEIYISFREGELVPEISDEIITGEDL